MKHWKLFVASLLLGCGLVLNFAGCKNPRLEPGGAYAPTNAAPDLVLFQIDSAYLLAYNTIDTVFTLERNNRQLLWDFNPGIKHALDNIRPDALRARNDFIAARKAYALNPTPAGQTQLQEILGRVRQFSEAAAAAIPQNSPVRPGARLPGAGPNIVYVDVNTITWITNEPAIGHFDTAQLREMELKGLQPTLSGGVVMPVNDLDASRLQRLIVENP